MKKYKLIRRSNAIILLSVILYYGNAKECLAYEKFRHPVASYTITQYYNNYRSGIGYHTGVDYSSSSTSIYASASGTIVTMQINGEGCSGCSSPGQGCLDHGLGNTIILRHQLEGGGYIYSLYAHLSAFASGISLGDCVDKGQVIGSMGGTGYGCGDYWATHLHFEIKDSDTLSNPSGTGTYWGYTPSSADYYGYHNPLTYIDNDGYKAATCTPEWPPPRHSLIKEEGDTKVYIFINDSSVPGSDNRIWIPDQAAAEAGWGPDWNQQIIEYSAGTLSALPIAPMTFARRNSQFKIPGHAGVYKQFYDYLGGDIGIYSFDCSLYGDGYTDFRYVVEVEEADYIDYFSISGYICKCDRDSDGYYGEDYPGECIGYYEWDCDDYLSYVNPGEVEEPYGGPECSDGLDNDCDGLTDGSDSGCQSIPEPELCHSPTSFAFSASEGGSNPSSQTLRISNCGSGTMSWSVSESASWLILSPTSGSSTGETDNVTVSVNISGLSCGIHNTNITITAPGAIGSPKTVPVSLTITGQLTLVSSPSSFTFSATEGGSNPSSQTLSISKSGCGTMSWSVSESASWLSLSPTSGTSTGETDNVTVSVNISGLSCGTHNTNITITASGATGSPKTVPVSLTISGQPTLTSSPSSFTFSATEGGSNPASQTLSISKSGCGTMSWSVSESASWLSLSPTSGSSSGEIDNVTVSVNISGQSCGTHNTNITITAPGATGSPKTVPVSLTITGQPTLVSSPSSFSFSATEGGSNPASQTLSISKSGCGTMSWSVAESASWLSLSPTSGSSTGETDNVTVSVNISGLSGSCEPYEVDITISAPGAIGSPKTVPVSLLVKPVLQFTDVPLPGQTQIKAVHLTELRGYIDCLRSSQGLGGYEWTDGTITSGVTVIKAEHILELQTALESVVPDPSWSGDVSEGLVIRAEHIEEIRDAIEAVW